MEIVSFDPARPGLFAFGQEACGIFAFGQLATGVIAIGQVARGVIAVGQAAVGVVAIGQAALGVLYAGGMFAIGGRGFGLCLKVLPKFVWERFEPPMLPPVRPLADFVAARIDEGWTVLEVSPDRPELLLDGAPAPIELENAEIRGQLKDAVTARHNRACVRVIAEHRADPSAAGNYRAPVDRVRAVVGRRLISWREAPPQLRIEGPFTSVGGLALRGLLMIAVVYAYGVLALGDIVRMFAS